MIDQTMQGPPPPIAQIMTGADDAERELYS
jgi:hypothetical protein